MEGVDQPLQILNPRNPGESLKVAETVLRKRNRDLKGQAERAQKRIDVKKVTDGRPINFFVQEAARQRIDLGVVTPEKLVKDGLVKQLDSKRYFYQFDRFCYEPVQSCLIEIVIEQDCKIEKSESEATS